MANEIKLKRSAVAGKAPTTTDLGLGELALNTTDGKAYMKKSDNGVESIVEITGSGLSDILMTKKVIEQDLTIEAGYNGMSILEVTVDDGVTLEIPDGSEYMVVGGLSPGSSGGFANDDLGLITSSPTSTSDYGALD